MGELTHRPSSLEKAHGDFHGGGVIIGISKYTFTVADAVMKSSVWVRKTYRNTFLSGSM